MENIKTDGGVYAEHSTPAQTRHDIPKCSCCGYVGRWKVEPALTFKHWMIGLFFTIFGVVPGIVYLVTSLIIRSGSKNRSKICTKCKAQNMFTFIY